MMATGAPASVGGAPNAREDAALRRFRTPSTITEHILLGSYTHAINTRVLLEMGVTHVLNVHTSHRFRDSPFTVQHIPISDYGTDDLNKSGILEQCFDVISSVQGKHFHDGKPMRILVHCSKGVNRSPTVVIAFLMKHLGWSLRKAYTHVTTVRTEASPHESYFAQLQQLEQEWFDLTEPTLSREEAGPSLQQILREIAAGQHREKYEERKGGAGEGSAESAEERKGGAGEGSAESTGGAGGEALATTVAAVAPAAAGVSGHAPRRANEGGYAGRGDGDGDGDGDADTVGYATDDSDRAIPAASEDPATVVADCTSVGEA